MNRAFNFGVAFHEPDKDGPPLHGPLLPPREERENATVQGPNARPELEVEAFHEPSWTEAGKLVTGNLSLVIGHLEADTAKRRLRQSPITSDQ